MGMRWRSGVESTGAGAVAEGASEEKILSELLQKSFA